MNRVKRAKLLGAMEFIARQINDESIFERWLIDGVGDGDINRGDMTPAFDDDIIYFEDETFAEIMGAFLSIIAEAKDEGGLYCDGIVSQEF